jgi:hypothetical protein
MPPDRTEEVTPDEWVGINNVTVGILRYIRVR